MRVRIEEEVYDGEINLEDLETFVEAVRASAAHFMHPGLQVIRIDSTRLVYEREK